MSEFKLSKHFIEKNWMVVSCIYLIINNLRSLLSVSRGEMLREVSKLNTQSDMDYVLSRQTHLHCQSDLTITTKLFTTTPGDNFEKSVKVSSQLVVSCSWLISVEWRVCSQDHWNRHKDVSLNYLSLGTNWHRSAILGLPFISSPVFAQGQMIRSW